MDSREAGGKGPAEAPNGPGVLSPAPQAPPCPRRERRLSEACPQGLLCHRGHSSQRVATSSALHPCPCPDFMSGSHLYILQDLSQESAGAGAGAFLTALHTALPGTSPGASLFSTQLSAVFFQERVHFFQVAHNSPILSQPVQHRRCGPSAFPRQPIRPPALLGAAPDPSLLAKRSPHSAFWSAPLVPALRVTLPLSPFGFPLSPPTLRGQQMTVQG